MLTDPHPATGTPERSAPNGAHAVFEVLRDWGIDLLLTCPGSTEAGILDASTHYPGIRTVLTTHESIAVAAADGYTRVTGRPAVAYLHANVGLANGIAHLSCAALTDSPVVVLNGIKSTEIGNRGGFTTAAYQQDYVRQHVRLGRIALRADGIADDLTRALKAATAEPGGPVYLGLPQDLVETIASLPLPHAAKRRVAARRRPDPAAVGAAAAILAPARAVTIVAGSAIADDASRAALTALADRLDAPVVLEDRRTMTASGIHGDHPLFAGTYAATNPAVANADVLLFAGMRAFVEFEPAREPLVPPGKRVVHLSADAEAIARVADVDVGIVANVAFAMRDLLTVLGIAPTASRRAHREKSIEANHDAVVRGRADRTARLGDAPIHPAVMMEALHQAIPDDCWIVGDAVTSGGYLADALLPGTRREYVTTAGGSLGWGMGAALGVQLGHPQARVVAVIGDGVFQFGIQALWTAAALHLPVTFVVIDNASYAAVKAALKRYRSRNGIVDHGAYPASELPNTDIAAIARGFGAHAQTVERLADLHGAMERAFATRGPSVVVVKTDSTHTGP
jgi:benzoylformate decarboxylase